VVGGVTAPGGPDDGADPVAIDETRLRALPSAAAELSGDVTAFDVRRAVDETRERRDPVYWVDLEVPEGWVLIGDNGQGDEWDICSERQRTSTSRTTRRSHVCTPDWMQSRRSSASAGPTTSGEPPRSRTVAPRQRIRVTSNCILGCA